ITVFGQRPGNAINDDHWNVLTIDTAPYVNTELALGRLGLVAGLRFEPVLVEGSPILPLNGTTPPRGYARFVLPQNPVDVLSYAPTPRLPAASHATRKLTLTAGGGVYSQPPSPEDMSPVFG